MPDAPKGSHHEDDFVAKSVLMGDSRALRFGRGFFRMLPSEPRCKLCYSPFSGVGGLVMRPLGKRPWPKNPKYCSSCFKQMADHRGGAEIECSLVFADVRGSTSLAETMRPAEFRRRMNEFFAIASHALVEQDGFVDKFVGDEVIGIFVPGLAGQSHARKAIQGARDLVSATARALDLPVGAGVNTDLAYVGTVGEGSHVEFTAMGDAVNVTARLASAAGAGEILVTVGAAANAGLDTTAFEHRRLELKGKSDVVEVLVLGGSAEG